MAGQGEMNTKRFFSAIILLMMFLVLAGVVSAANIITISNYETKISVSDNKISFEKRVTLQNTGKNTIIPGELHFKLYEITDNDERTIPKISNLVSTDLYNNDLSARVVSKKGEAEVVISAWQPILPQFDYDIILKYSIDFIPKGILFHNLNFPDEETTIPIISTKTIITLPSKYTISYAPNATVTKGNGVTSAEWKNVREKTIEYTLMPFIKTNIHGATIFWITLIIILSIPLLIILVGEILHRKNN